MTLPSSKNATEPTLRDLLNQFSKEISLSLNCHAIATVESFNPVNQTITATINYKKVFNQQTGVTGKFSQVLVDYPLVIDAPVVILGGGSGTLTFPIAQGDECLLLFNDRDIDNWFSSSQTGTLATTRTHSFADAVALVGLRSATRFISDYDATHTLLKQNGVKVGVGSTKLVAANNTDSLKSVLEALVTAIKAIQVTCSTPGNPSVLPLVNVADFIAITARLEGLLE